MDHAQVDQIIDALNSIAVAQRRIANALEEQCQVRGYRAYSCNFCGCSVIPLAATTCPACKDPVP